MKLYHIAAIGRNNAIGKDGEIPWKLSCDLMRFAEITKHHALIMGRKTYEGLGKPLPNRTNIVLTRNRAWDAGKHKGAANLKVVHSIAQAMDEAFSLHEEVYIGGGEGLYRDTLDQVDCLRITHVNQTPEADTFYPEIDASIWVPSHVITRSGYAYVDYVRRETTNQALRLFPGK